MSDCQLFTGPLNSGGYGNASIGGHTVSAHRLAYALAYGCDPGQYHVLHRCDVPACVNPDHLFLGTHQDNMRDRGNKGRGHRGDTHCFAKLRTEQIPIIRQLLADGHTHRAIAARFGVDHSTITRLARGKTWRLA